MRSYRDIQSGGCIFRRCRREGAAELAEAGGVGWAWERERAERDILSLEFWLNNGARDVCACTSAKRVRTSCFDVWARSAFLKLQL